MDNKQLSKKDYFLSKYHQIIPNNFHIHWSPTPFVTIYLGRAAFSFKPHGELKETPLKKWSFEFEETAPEFIKAKIIENSKTDAGHVTPSLGIPSVRFLPYEDIYEQLFFRICPPGDDDALGMKNFYNHVFSRIEDPQVKKLVLETIKEWSQPGYCLSKHCQYILKEIEEKEGKDSKDSTSPSPLFVQEILEEVKKEEGKEEKLEINFSKELSLYTSEIQQMFLKTFYSLLERNNLSVTSFTVGLPDQRIRTQVNWKADKTGNIIEGSEKVITDPYSPSFAEKCIQAIREGSPYPFPPKVLIDTSPDKQVEVLLRFGFRV